MAVARDEVLDMLRGTQQRGAAGAPSTRDEVLSMMTAAPESSSFSLPAIPGAVTEQAGRMGRFFTEGIPQAARTTYEGMKEAATAPTFGQSLMRRSRPEPVFGGPPTQPGIVDQITGGVVGSAADLAERFMGMAASIGRGAGTLGPMARPGHPDPLVEAAVNAALPMAPTLARGVGSMLRRAPRALPAQPPPVPDPLAGDVSSVRSYRQGELPPGPREPLALPPAPPEVSGWPEVTTTTTGLTREPIPQPPVLTPKRAGGAEPPPVIRGSRVIPSEEELILPRRVEAPPRPLRSAEDIAFERAGGDPTIPPERPTRFIDEQGRPIMEPRPGFRPSENLERPAEVAQPPEAAAPPRLQPPQEAPIVAPRVPEVPPEPPPAPEMAPPAREGGGFRGLVPPIPLPGPAEEDEGTLKGYLQRGAQVLGLAAPLIGMAAARRGQRPPTVPQEFRSERVGSGSYRPPASEPVSPPPVEPTPPTLGGTVDRPGAVDQLLKPGAMQGVKDYAREFYSPIISQMERMGVPGKELSRRVQVTEGQAQTWYGRTIEPLVQMAKRLTPAEAENFWDVVERGAAPVTARLRAFVEGPYRRVFGEQGVIPTEASGRNFVVMDSAGEARPFQARSMFAPHEFAPEVVKEIRARGLAYDKMVKHLLDTGQAHDAETAGIMVAERFNFQRATLGERIFLMDPDRFVGGLERARDLDLPDYIRDPAAAIAARGMKVSRRFAELDNYGRLDAEIGAPGGYLDPLTNERVPAHGLIGEIQRTQGRDAANHAATLFQQALGHSEWQPGLAGKQALSEGVRSFEAFTKLPLAAIANASQFAQVAARTNLTSAAKGLAASATRAGREAARDLGVISDMSLRQLYEDVTGGQTIGSRAMKVAMGPFNTVEKWDRIVGANAGLAWARKIEQQLASGRGAGFVDRELARLNFSPEEVAAIKQAGALTDEQRSRAAWAVADQTQFIGKRYRRSEKMNDPFWAMVLQFKSFSINAGRMLKQNVLDEARHGNLAPLARVAVLFPLVGEGVQDVKAILRGSERPDGPIARALDNVMAVGGMGLAADFVDSIAKRGKWGAASFAVGPFISDIFDASDKTMRLGKAIGEGDEDKIGRRANSLGQFAARQIPFIGPTLGTALRDDPKGRQLQEMTVGERLKFE